MRMMGVVFVLAMALGLAAQVAFAAECGPPPVYYPRAFNVPGWLYCPPKPYKTPPLPYPARLKPLPGMLAPPPPPCCMPDWVRHHGTVSEGRFY